MIWKHQKKPEGMGIAANEIVKGPIIARIEAQNVPGKAFPATMLGIGIMAIILAFLFEDSAIRLAAWGAIWTGWNVLWGTAVLAQRETNYVVYRELEQHDGKAETQA